LSYEDYAFTLTFSSLKYNLQRNIQYSYFLENLDKEWQYNTADKRYIHYTNLSPGKYILKVRASYDGIHWSETPKVLKITIVPPWWSTLWFKGLAILILVISFLALHKLRIGFLEKQSHKLEGLVSQRTCELERSNKEIQELLDEVAKQKDKIEIKNLELQEANEEVSAQRDNLARKSFELEKARFELQKVNVKLEELVQKRTETLNRTVQELETFLYRASHDLQGPISSMRGLISLAKLESNQTKPNIEYNELIESSVLKLESTLRKLLEKHAIQRIRPYYELLGKTEIVELLNVTTKGTKCFRPQDFEFKIDEQIQLYTDKNLLSIILKSLLENAFFFSEHSDNKKVFLNINTSGHKVNISVRDFGSGINEAVKDKIFNMFFRGNQLSKGNGLGLYIVKCALNKINGKIEVETTEGSFSNFIITLDATHEPGEANEVMSDLNQY
jgi:signal transduction histidine kinase